MPAEASQRRSVVSVVITWGTGSSNRVEVQLTDSRGRMCVLRAWKVNGRALTVAEADDIRACVDDEIQTLMLATLRYQLVLDDLE